MTCTFSNLRHITGDLAYLIYWLVVYDCKVNISSVEAIDQNLEIITNAEGDMLAFRYDYPGEIQSLISGYGEWHLYNPEKLNPEELIELEGMIIGLMLSKQFKN